MRPLIRRNLGAVLVAAMIAATATAGVVAVAPDRPVATATPTPTATPACLASANCFPKPQGSSLPGVTGIPTGTTLSSCGTNVTLSTPGQTVNGCNYAGKVTVTAANVTIRNSRIVGGITTSSTGLVVEDSDIGPDTCGQFGDIVAAVKWSDYTLRRNHIHGNSDGLRIGGGGKNILVQDNHVVVCYDSADPGSHMDGLQSENPSDLAQSNIVITHNTIDIRPCAGHGCNSAIFFADNARLGTVTDNLLLAPLDSFALKIHDDHTPDVGPWVVTGNRFVGNTSTTNTTCSGTGSKMTWSDNRAVTINSDYTIATTGSVVNC